MRILLDTNILIAAFIVHGVCAELLDHCIRRYRLITSEFILDEFLKKLVHKLKYDHAEAEEAIGLLKLKMEIVKPVMLKTQICRDADDDIILGTAIAGNANCIITGDKDLLTLKEFDNIDIISPSEFPDYERRRIQKD